MDIAEMMSAPIMSSPVWSPRIEHHVFTVTQFLFLSIAIIAAGTRTSLRVYRSKKITIDDVFLILACVFFAASTAVIHYGKNLVYRSTYFNLGLAQYPKDYQYVGLQYSIIDNAVTSLVWASLFSVKLSFIFFFRQLISRVRHIQMYWWVVFVVICCAAPVNMFMGFYICPEFDVHKLQTSCPNRSILAKTHTYLLTSCIIDIVTDVLVLSIPILLLWKVKIDLRRKLALLTILCLSVFMIIIAIVRVALVDITLPNGRSAPDTIWLFFWQNIEAATAIIMVSITAFRSMLGQSANSPKPSKPSAGSASSRRYLNLRSNPTSSEAEPLSPSTSSANHTRSDSAASTTANHHPGAITKTTELSSMSEKQPLNNNHNHNHNYTQNQNHQHPARNPHFQPQPQPLSSWPRTPAAISAPVRSLDAADVARQYPEPQRDWARSGRLPRSPAVPQGGQVQVQMQQQQQQQRPSQGPADRRFEESGALERA